MATDPDFIPYGRQSIDEADIAAVVEVLRSDYLTTGPMIGAFESAVAAYTGAAHGVAVNSGTAALHAALSALNLQPGDEVVVPAITFAASANAVLYVGATPVFADVEPDTLLLDVADAERCIGARTRAIIAVDYAGHPCDYGRLRQLADKHALALIADGCHALGARWHDRPVGSLADMTAFSFHPVKHLTTGEGGMVVTDDETLARAMRRFRSHGIDIDAAQRLASGTFRYEMTELGYNYRLTDLQCALGRSQLSKQSAWLTRRQAIARTYDEAFARVPGVTPLAVRAQVSHAYHLYVVRLDKQSPSLNRDTAFQTLRKARIGVNVHYLPVYLHPYYQQLGYAAGLCPCAEAAYEEIISLPMYPTLADDQVQRVIREVGNLGARHG